MTERTNGGLRWHEISLIASNVAALLPAFMVLQKKLSEGSDYFLGSSSAEDESYEESENSVYSIKEDEVDEENEISECSIEEDELDEESENSERLTEEDERNKIQRIQPSKSRCDDDNDDGDYNLESSCFSLKRMLLMKWQP